MVSSIRFIPLAQLYVSLKFVPCIVLTIVGQTFILKHAINLLP